MTQTQTTTINVRVDDSIKRNVEVLFDSMGMNISTAVNMFFRQCLLEQALPFQPRAKQRATLKEALREAQEQAIINGTSTMSLDEINDMIREVRRERGTKNEPSSN